MDPKWQNFLNGLGSKVQTKVNQYNEKDEQSKEVNVSAFNILLRNDAKSKPLNYILDNFVNFYNNNKDNISFDMAFKLINCVVTILKGNKKENDYILHFIEFYLGNYKEFDSVDFVEKRFKMYLKVDKDSAFDFLHNRNLVLIEEIQDFRMLLHNLYVESEFLFSKKRLDDAFRNLCKSNQYAYNLDPKDCVFWFCRNHELMAKICLKENKIESHIKYLINITATYFFKALYDYLNFPPLTITKRVPDEKLRYWRDHFTLDIDKVFQQLKLSSLNEYLFEVNNYVKYTIPSLYGIPKNHLNSVRDKIYSEIELSLLKELGFKVEELKYHELPSDFLSTHRKLYLEAKQKMNENVKREYFRTNIEVIELSTKLLNSFDYNIFNQILVFCDEIVAKYIKSSSVLGKS